MKKPAMILFDYGQTLIAEAPFDGVAGMRALMKHAVKNKYNYTPEQLWAERKAIYRDMGRVGTDWRYKILMETPNYMQMNLLFESLGIEIDLPPEAMDRMLWDATSPGTPTEGIEDFLSYLSENGIRTGVVSNIAYSSRTVAERIQRLSPGHRFEFSLAASDYIFRKPNARFFRLALEKAELKPEDVWYIGDSYLCDVVGSRNAGMFPVWYKGCAADPNGEDDALTVSSWTQLRQLMEA